MYNLCTDDQCCYLYGSVPRNDSNCVPENGQFTLQYIIYNPHDPFTNLTVRWFRSMDMTRAISLTEVITTSISGEYDLTIFQSSPVDRNCSHGSLYRNTFVLIIHNFTTDKDGYYWCQIVVNDSYLQPSQYAWFYAADRSSCTQELHFITASENEIQCAENYTNTCTVITEPPNTFEMATVILPSTTYLTRVTDTAIASTFESTTEIAPSTTYLTRVTDTAIASTFESTTEIAPSTTYLTRVTDTAIASTFESTTEIAPSTTYLTSITTIFPTTPKPTMMTMVFRMTQSVIYVAGFFSVLLVLLGTLVIILLLLLCVHKNKSHRKKIQIKGEPIHFLCLDFQHAHAL